MFIKTCGEVPEWSNGAVSKTVVRFAYPGFESLSLRHHFERVNHINVLSVAKSGLPADWYRKLVQAGAEMGARTPNYLTRRGERYYFRRALPGHLRRRFNRSEIKVSLGTDQLASARRRCRSATNCFERIVQVVDYMPELTSQAINQLVRDYFAASVQGVYDIMDVGPGLQDPGFDVPGEIEGTTEWLDELRKRLVVRKYGADIEHDASELLDGAGYDAPASGSDTWRALRDGVLRAQIERARIYLALLNGDHADTVPKDPLFRGGANQPAEYTSGMLGDEVGTVGELAEKFIAAKSGHVWTHKTLLDNKRVLRWFREIVGDDLPITSVNKAHVEAYRDMLLRLPPRSTDKKYQGMTVMEIIEAADGDKTISLRSADKYLKMMKGFLHWCVDEEHIKSVPGQKIAVPYKGATGDEREPYSSEQLEVLFNSPVYTGCKSKGRRNDPGELVFRDGKFWIPLIGLLTGMRLGEIVQMYVSDLRQEDGIWFFDVTTVEHDTAELTDDELAKSLKTPQSKRRIPVHQELIKAGLLRYREDRKKMVAAGKRLFPEIKPGAGGYYSHNFSKWFSRALIAWGIKTPKHVFHSLRHNFKDSLHIAGIEDSHQDTLMGHLDMKQSKSGYGGGKGVPLKALAADMEKLECEVDLSHLYQE